MVEQLVQLGPVPIRNRYRLRARDKAIPCVLDEPQALRWRELHDLVEQGLGDPGYMMVRLGRMGKGRIQPRA